jgi:hypothetical protein
VKLHVRVRVGVAASRDQTDDILEQWDLGDVLIEEERVEARERERERERESEREQERGRDMEIRVSECQK